MRAVIQSVFKLATLVAVLVVSPLNAYGSGGGRDGPPVPTEWREVFAQMIAKQALIYGFPAMKYAQVRYMQTHGMTKAVDAEVNSFFHVKRLADYTDQINSSVNRDTLYSIGWLDLRDGPLVFEVEPTVGGRYQEIQLTDFYSDVFGYVTTRLHNYKPIRYLVVGPDWKNDPDMESEYDGVLRAPTPWAYALGRTFTTGEDNDLALAFAAQQGMKITPLFYETGMSAEERIAAIYQPVVDPNDPLTRLTVIDAVLRENPPPARDRALAEQFGKVGIGPFAMVPLAELDEGTKRGLAAGVQEGLALLQMVAEDGGDTKVVNNWFFGDMDWGRMAANYDYLGRASPQSFSGMQEHWNEVATKLRVFVDANGEPLDGSKAYRIRFTKDNLPPADAFWSITVYNERFNLVQSAYDRYLVSDTTPGLQYDTEGGLTVYLQAEPPKDAPMANWIPTPSTGSFNLFLRAYLPGQSLIDQSYVPPFVELEE